MKSHEIFSWKFKTDDNDYMSSKINRVIPWFFIPTLYFAEGIPFVLTNQLSAAMYKSFDVSASIIGLTSFLYLPWSLKLFWAPLIDSNKTKRFWIVAMQLALALSFALMALSVNIPFFLTVSLIVFTLTAFLSATHDIAIDGYYLFALDQKQQAFFTGIRSTFYRFAMIFAGGLLVSLAGWTGDSAGSVNFGWTVSFSAAALFFFALFVYHNRLLPYPADDKPVRNKQSAIPYKTVFKEYFSQSKIGIIILFILLYRLGEGILVKMAQPFLLDGRNTGGLELSLAEVGINYGTLGVVALIIGGILGGWLIKKFGLRKLLLPLALCMNLPNLLYVYLAATQPTNAFALDLSGFVALFGSDSSFIITLHPIVQVCVIIEQFGYGLGFTAFMVYLLYISKGAFRTSHYAISTGIMAVGMMLPGLLSGFLQEWLGWLNLFIFSFIFTIPGMLALLFLPKVEEF